MGVRTAMDATALIGHPTGVGNFVAGLIPSLVARGVEVGAYALSFRGSSALAERLPGGVERIGARLPAGALMALWRRVPFPSAELLLGDCDVVHGTNFVVPPTRKAAALVTVHDLTALRYPEMCAPRSLAYPDLVRAAARRGAHVHTPTAAIAAEVVDDLGIESERVHAVHHGCNPLPTGPGTEADAGRRIAGAERYVLAVGTVEPRKGYPALVRAFDMVADDHADLRLAIAGGPGWGSGAFFAAVENARHSDRIALLGWVDDASRAALIRGAAVLVFPSVYEGFGLPPLEAMSEGVPVVATSTAAAREVIGDAGLLVNTGDDAALAAAITTALDDGPERARLATAGRERVAAFTWERTAAAMAGLYERLAGVA